MLENIPAELKALNQWVCGTKAVIKSQDKIPINPLNGTKASPTDSRTWTTFNAALERRTEQWPHVGFVLSSEDPYCIIDLDDPYNPDKQWSEDQRETHAKLNQKIMDSFESYTEISQSGRGVHIVVRGSVPHGVNRDTVEMYSTQRYMVCTGNVLKDLPIIDCQPMLDTLFAEMDSAAKGVELVETADTLEDTEIVEMAMSAMNGEKFTDLCNGHFSEYPSQSEADLALLSIIAFYTDSNEQVRRIFRMTQLGKREKAVKNDTYLNFALSKIRANAPVKVDFGELEKRVQALINKPEAQAATSTNEEKVLAIVNNEPTHTAVSQPDDPDLFPPGLIGELAEYIYASAARPVREFGLMGAIGLMAGLVGRQYNVSGVGLNHYLILLAKTGTGKEGIVGGIDRLTNAVRKSVPMVDNFSGPSAFASGPALVKYMSESPCFLSVLGEFGLTLQQICDPKAMGAHVSLRHALLDLYQKSGWHSTLKASVYSDKEKNTDLVRSPALSVLGESTPETFLEGLSEHHIADGLIPRFTIREYTGNRPYLNENNGFPPAESLIRSLTDLVTIVLTMQANEAHVDVVLDAKSKVLSDAFEKETTDLINNSSNQLLTQLWNRAHLKVLKLAALIAVGCNYNAPVITERHFNWAMAFVKQDIATLLNRFEKGEVGNGESKQEADFIRKVNEYFTKKPKSLFKKFHDRKVIPASWMRDHVKQLSSFKNDSRGQSRALTGLIEAMVDSGMLNEMPKPQAQKEFQTSGKVYALGDQWPLE
jgi:hypothetical protein